jgi:phospholipid transport system substrate-binding protein
MEEDGLSSPGNGWLAGFQPAGSRQRSSKRLRVFRLVQERQAAMISQREPIERQIREVIAALERQPRKKGKPGQIAGKSKRASARAVHWFKPAVSAAIKAIRRPRFTASLLFLFCFLPLPAASSAGSPTEQVRNTVDKVLTIVRSPNSKSKAQIEAQRAQLLEVIYPRFDFTEMAKRSLGPHWARQTREEQREFIEIFAALMGRAYAGNIESYTSQNVLYTRESEDQNYAQVDTKIVGDNQATVSINYKLHSVGNEWKIYDLVIEDISVVNNYRSQFNRVLARSSFAELVRMMKEKQP